MPCASASAFALLRVVTEVLPKPKMREEMQRGVCPTVCPVSEHKAPSFAVVIHVPNCLPHVSVVDGRRFCCVLCAVILYFNITCDALQFKKATLLAIMIANGHKQPDEKSALKFLAALPKAIFFTVSHLCTHNCIEVIRADTIACQICSRAYLVQST